jgi:hypothetical protein
MVIYLGGALFSVNKAYMALSGHPPTHPVFIRLWSSKCQLKHRFFFCLLLQDKLNSRDRLRRRHMELDSYTCEKCILERDTIPSIHKVQFCKKLLGFNWGDTTQSQLPTEGSKQNQRTIEGTMCNEDYYPNVVEYMKMLKWMDL